VREARVRGSSFLFALAGAFIGGAAILLILLAGPNVFGGGSGLREPAAAGVPRTKSPDPTATALAETKPTTPAQPTVAPTPPTGQEPAGLPVNIPGVAYVDPPGDLRMPSGEIVAHRALHPAWAPDGSGLAYVTYDGQTSVLRWVNAKTGQDEALTDPIEGMVRNLVWERDGGGFLFHEQPAGHSSTRIVRFDWESKTTTTVLTTGQLDLADASIQGFGQFPDGRLVVQISIAPDENQYANGCGLYTVDPKDGAASALVPLKQNACYGLPSVAPDGSKVAFLSYPGDGAGYLAVVASDGSGYRQLSQLRLRGTADYPFWPRISWSPDSQRVIYETIEDDEVVFSQDADDTTGATRSFVVNGHHPAFAS
jgi:hypothetical protein